MRLIKGICYAVLRYIICPLQSAGSSRPIAALRHSTAKAVTEIYFRGTKYYDFTSRRSARSDQTRYNMHLSNLNVVYSICCVITAAMQSDAW